METAREIAVKLLQDESTAVVFGGALHVKPGFKDKLIEALIQFAEAQVREAEKKQFSEMADACDAHQKQARMEGFSECREKAIKAFPCIISLHDPCGNCVNCMTQVRLRALTPDGETR